MSKFTAGRWNYLEEYIPEGITQNKKEYLIQSESRKDVALVCTEANARLIAVAPEMYECLKLLARIFSLQAREGTKNHIAPAIINCIYELLAKIDNEPVENMKHSSSFF